MARPEIEGDWIQGWPDRARARLMPSKDAEGRTIYARTPLLQLEGVITPTDAFYIVAQLNMCEPIFPDDYELNIKGMVDKPMTLKLADIMQLPSKTVRTVMECAGDDGEFFHWQKRGGIKPTRLKRQKEQGGWNQMGSADGKRPTAEQVADAVPTTCLVSGGEWTGTPLKYVLDMVGMQKGVVTAHFVGYDKGRPDPTPQYAATGRTDIEIHDPGIINYDKALPIEKALHPDTILCWAHNGEYLQHVHGAPLRLVVPGWSGNWSVKWIKDIELLDHTPECYYQDHYFVHGQSADDPNRRPCMELGCKSIILNPIDEDSPLEVGKHLVKGLAWSGKGAVRKMEVSVDGGETWHLAHLDDHNDRWLWRRWSYVWNADKPGKYSIMARATDEEQRVQPQTPWNFQTKHFDGIVPVEVEVR
jgi:DMSO/TMAO reductase YedYZ molybdopterin-dependent catalytic subunit